MKISDPTPAATRPGTSTSPSVGPPSPEASISRNAPSRGDPSSVLTAAKLPAAATTAVAWSGTSRLARRTANAARPAPSAISGPGPSTAPGSGWPAPRSRCRAAPSATAPRPP